MMKIWLELNYYLYLTMGSYYYLGGTVGICVCVFRVGGIISGADTRSMIIRLEMMTT